MTLQERFEDFSLADLLRDDAFFDAAVADRASIDDAPAELADLVRLVQIARGPADPFELAGEERTVAAMLAAFEEATPKQPTAPRRIARAGRRMAAMGVAGALLAGGVAAAATGSLPAPAQSTVSSVLSHVGIAVSDGKSADEPHEGRRSSPDRSSETPTQDGAASQQESRDDNAPANAKGPPGDKAADKSANKPTDTGKGAGKPDSPGKSAEAPGHSADGDPGNSASSNARANR